MQSALGQGLQALSFMYVAEEIWTKIYFFLISKICNKMCFILNLTSETFHNWNSSKFFSFWGAVTIDILK